MFYLLFLRPGLLKYRCVCYLSGQLPRLRPSTPDHHLQVKSEASTALGCTLHLPPTKANMSSSTMVATDAIKAAAVCEPGRRRDILMVCVPFDADVSGHQCSRRFSCRSAITVSSLARPGHLAQPLFFLCQGNRYCDLEEITAVSGVWQAYS